MDQNKKNAHGRLQENRFNYCHTWHRQSIDEIVEIGNSGHLYYFSMIEDVRPDGKEKIKEFIITS